MNTLTLKLPPTLDEAVRAAAEAKHVSRSELVRCALENYLRLHENGEKHQASMLDRAGDLVGCFEGGPEDLASNPKHLAGFGRV